MSVFLDRVNSVPLDSTQFGREIESWLQTLVDTINSTFELIETNLNLNLSQSMTAAQIAALDLSTLPDGFILYDSTNNVYVGKASGALIQFTTAVYP
jgi:hypothetical protein